MRDGSEEKRRRWVATKVGVDMRLSEQRLDPGTQKMGRFSIPKLGILLLCCLAAVSEATYAKYKDPKQPVGVRIEDLMSRMTLAEKIGQMTQIERSVATPDGVFEWQRECAGHKSYSLSTRLQIPMIYGIDAAHGHTNVYKATIFPHNVGLGVTMDPQLIKKIGDATALKVRATGIFYVFAPCIAVCRDPRWGRCYESYSEDHKIVQLMTEIIPGLQGDIPGNSKKGVPFVSGNWNGKKMHANRDLVTGFLKNKLKFRGFVISDWFGIDKITSPPHANYSYSVEAGVGAGIDMIMVSNFTEFIDVLTYQVKHNIIPMSRIDDAVKRILRVKFVMGLFENPMADYSLVNQLGSQEHRELAREAVRKTLVLLKNGESADKPLLPLPKKATKILVSGTHADNLGYQCGGWTITWQGLGGNDLTSVVYSENPDSDFVKSNKFSFAIVVVGEPLYAETFGDSLNHTLSEPGPRTIYNVCGAVKCVVVVISGRPVVMQPYLSSVNALVVAWLPGTEGQGVADVLFGDYGFTGKLARTWFKTVDQLPMNVGDPHYDPLFPFGFGLTTKPTE
ncbi:hypothetical protein Goari_022175, partial [Gossypium aridum]|nr:hypothetical protein [Gossypium aridum]